MTHPASSSDNRIDRTCGDRMCDHKGAYVVAVMCTNCRWTGGMSVTKTHEAWRAAMGAECPRCECRQIRAGEFIGEDVQA